MSGPSLSPTDTSHTLHLQGPTPRAACVFQLFCLCNCLSFSLDCSLQNVLTEFPFSNLNSNNNLFLQPSLLLNGFQESLSWKKAVNFSNPIPHYTDRKTAAQGGSGHAKHHRAHQKHSRDANDTLLTFTLPHSAPSSVPGCQLSLSSRNKANTYKASLLRKIRGNIGRKHFKILIVAIFGWVECRRHFLHLSLI